MKLNYFNIAIMDICISQYTEHAAFALGNIMWNIANRQCTEIYSPSKKGKTEIPLFHYYPTENTEIKKKNYY